MAMLFGDSFDAYSAGLGDLTEKWLDTGAGTGINATGGRFGFGAYQFTDDGNTPITSRNFSSIIGSPTNPRGGTLNPFRFAAHVKMEGGLSGEDDFLRIYTDDDSRADIRVDSSGRIVVRRLDATSSNSPAATGIVNIADGNWHHIELELVFDNSNGVIKLWVDGIADISETTIDSLSDGTFGTNGIDIIELHGYANSANSFWDDVVCWDDEGSFTGQLGQHRFDLLTPNADGTTTDFTTSTGVDHHALVDETPANDSDYVESGTSTEKDLFEYTDLSVTPNSIAGVLVNTRAFNPDIGAISMNMVARSNTTEADSPNRSLTSSARLYQHFFDQDPDTTSAWTKTGIDSAEFGVKVV